MVFLYTKYKLGTIIQHVQRENCQTFPNSWHFVWESVDVKFCHTLHFTIQLTFLLVVCWFSKSSPGFVPWLPIKKNSTSFSKLHHTSKQDQHSAKQHNTENYFILAKLLQSKKNIIPLIYWSFLHNRSSWLGHLHVYSPAPI